MSESAAVLTLEVSIQGMALWIDRNGYYDVLIPDDGLAPDHPDHHAVRIVADKTFDVDKICVDLTGLHPRPATAITATPSGFLSMRYDSNSLAADPQITVHGQSLIGALKLPYGAFSNPAANQAGPFHYDGATAVYLSNATVWSCTFDEPTEVFCSNTTFGVTSAPSIEFLGMVSTTNPLLRIEVNALSHNDLHDGDRITKGDQLTEIAALHRLTDGTNLSNRQNPVFQPIQTKTYLRSASNNLCPNTHGKPR